MLGIAGQTAGLIELKFFVDTPGLPLCVLGLKDFIFFHGQRRALQLVPFIKQFNSTLLFFNSIKLSY